jgi:predicted RND superfamily exporter protein
VLLIMTVLSGVYINVYVSGLGGNTLFFLAYLIVQSILMGATIDYSILLTNYYRESRHAGSAVRKALADAYRGAGHTILTSGLIIVLTPTLMFLLIDDPMIAMILKSLAIGAFSAILIILLVLPGVLAIGDRLVTKKK